MDDLWSILIAVYIFYRVLDRLKMLQSVGRIFIGIASLCKGIFGGLEKMLTFLFVPRAEQGKEESVGDRLASWAERVAKDLEEARQKETDPGGAEDAESDAKIEAQRRTLRNLLQNVGAQKAGAKSPSVAAAETASPLRAEAADLKQAVLWAEILAPPKARRRIRRR